MKKILLVMISLMILFVSGCSRTDKSEDDTVNYADLIFDDTFVHTVEVTMSKEDRTDQLENPKDKTKYKVDVLIDGEEFKDVGFQTKGNSSLYFTADAGKDKFSYQIEFNEYTKGQKFHGLDKLDLQNNFVDATMMKEYMAYWLFGEMGIDHPLASYVWLIVNGEVQGLYTALEDVDKSFLKRTRDGEGTIYKPEESELALTDEETDSLFAGGSAAHDSGGGADLLYRDDNEESYPDIFDNAKTKEDDNTRSRLIRALKALSEQKDLEEYLYTEEIIKYFAVHDFLVSYDSYTGLMLHNYCLYENNGKLAMLPWDYDSSFGGFPKDATVTSGFDINEIINTGIDSPLGDVKDEARPMWNWIPSDDNYRSEYHDELIDVVKIIDSKEFENEVKRVYELIYPYMEKDPKAFYSPERFTKACDSLISYMKLRSQSVQKQTDGKLATRSDQQNSEEWVDASAISISDMGSLDDLFS